LCDGVVPRSRLAGVLRRVEETAARHGVVLGTVAHVGDGNLHPTLLFNAAEPGVLDRVHEAHDEIIKLCIDAGGTITGEHGVGMEKCQYMPWLFAAPDLDRMRRVRDAFDPAGRFNPGKVLPSQEVSETRSAPLKVRATAAVGPDTWI
jgi:glycolate oxidase